MRSGTSCFNLTVWRKTFLRFWPIWAANLAFWALVLPLRGLMELRYGSEGFAAYVGEASHASLAFAVPFALMAAMAAFSHLWSARSANFTGALPVRREGLFMSSFLAGLGMLVLPNLVVFVLTLLVECAGNTVMLLPLSCWLGQVCGMEFFFYCFAVCLGMLLGHILALPVFYLIFNLIVMALYEVVSWVMRSFYYGWAPNNTGLVRDAVEWLTPVIPLQNALRCRVDSINTDNTVSVYEFEVIDGGILAVYAAAGLLLAVCALLLYRRRQLESAGDVVAVRALRPVFKYGVSVCAGLFLGYLTQIMLGFGTVGLMVAILLWGVAGCFVAQMILDKTFKVFGKWKGALAVAGVFVLLFVVVGFDLTGYETRVPDPAKVAYVEVSGLRGDPNDSGRYWDAVRVEGEKVSKVTALHRAAVDLRDSGNGAAVSPGSEWDVFWDVRLSYHLADGSVLNRSYDFWASEADRNVQGSALWCTQALLDDRELMRTVYGFDEMEELLAGGGSLRYAELRPSYDWEKYTYSYGEGDYPIPEETGAADSVSFYGGDAQDLWDAVRADFDAGLIGAHTLGGSSDNTEPLLLRFFFEERPDSSGDAPYTQPNYRSLEIVVQEGATRTKAALRTFSARTSLLQT